MEYKQRKKTLKTVFQLTLTAIKIVKAANPNAKEKANMKRIEKLFKHALFQIGKCRNDLQLEISIKNISAEIIIAQNPQPQPQFRSGGIMQSGYCTYYIEPDTRDAIPESEAQYDNRMRLAAELEKAFAKNNRHKINKK